jgi:hypothetical protein
VTVLKMAEKIKIIASSAGVMYSDVMSESLRGVSEVT